MLGSKELVPVCRRGLWAWGEEDKGWVWIWETWKTGGFGRGMGDGEQ